MQSPRESNPKCYDCNKTVYPLEAISTMEKTWHKSCFKCQECGTKLSQQAAQPHMATQKIYCAKHYPKAVATVVTDTPVLNTAKNAPKVDAASQGFNKATANQPSSVGDDVVSASKKTVPKVAVVDQSFNRATSEKPSVVGEGLAFQSQLNAPKIDVEQHKFSKATEDSKNTTVGVSVAFEAQQNAPKVAVEQQQYNKATAEMKPNFNVVV